MKKIIIPIFVLVTIVIVVVVIINGQLKENNTNFVTANNAKKDLGIKENANLNTKRINDNSGISNSPKNQKVKIFNLTAKNFSFSENEIRVKNGDKVKITLKSTQGTHDWVIDEFQAATKKISSGETAEVEFVVNKTGVFEYYCNVSNHRQLGMAGNLIVE